MHRTRVGTEVTIRMAQRRPAFASVEPGKQRLMGRVISENSE